MMFGRTRTGQAAATALVTASLIVGLTGWAGAAPPATGERPGPKVGDTAPDVTLKSLDGESVSLKSLREAGPVVLVVLRGYPGYQCPACTAQVGSFAGRAKDFQKAGASVVLVYPGAAVGLIGHAREFVSGAGTVPEPLTMVTDPDYKLVSAYGLRWDAQAETAYPSTFVIDRSGKIVFAKVSTTHGDRADVAAVLKAIPK